MREFKEDQEREFKEGIKQALFEMAKDGEIKKVLNKETGEIEYCLPQVYDNLDLSKYQKIEDFQNE